MGLSIPMSMPLSGAALRAGALEVVVLGGHLLLYPTGVCQEKVTTRPPATRPPVLLLHGFTDNRSIFVLLRRALGAGGRHVEAYNYSPFTLDLRVAARHLARHVEELCERTGQDRVDLVGHSLGGLVGRYYVQRLGGGTRVRTLVTLGTPHSGTRVALHGRAPAGAADPPGLRGDGRARRARARLRHPVRRVLERVRRADDPGRVGADRTPGSVWRTCRSPVSDISHWSPIPP